MERFAGDGHRTSQKSILYGTYFFFIHSKYGMRADCGLMPQLGVVTATTYLG
jgi:hypothetical protein